METKDLIRKSSQFSSSTAMLLRRNLWIWPIVGCLCILLLGWWTHRTIERTMKDEVAAELTTILDADIEALQIWLTFQEKTVEAIAQTTAVRTLIAELVTLAASADDPVVTLRDSSALTQLRESLAAWIVANDYVGFEVGTFENMLIASMNDDLIGKEHYASQEQVRERILAGEPTVSRPFPSVNLLSETGDRFRTGVPMMYAEAPIMDDLGSPIAILAFRIPPEGKFTEILNVARPGETGETYAFDRQGLLLSQSRFDEQLKMIGLLVDNPVAQSILTIEIRDPGVDMVAGNRPAVLRAEQPLTRMAAEATKGSSGYDVDGYNDYRGVPVVGAWRWLDDYGMGIATEIDVAEAYRPMYILRRAFAIIFGFLIASAVAIFIFTILVSRLNKRARREALKARKLGQYTLEERIGAGGMGAVYRGRHALLRRPTAIKLLNVDNTTPQSIARFEREVQLTSQLQHPNTIEVYDFGKTPEGIFYYVMEYLDGSDLEELVEQHGAQIESRVIHVLRQVCGSLVEAHGLGLIHRDIKPANIFLTRRAGMYDVVKLLDFGLVKAVDSRSLATLTQANTWSGTPLYMAPEAFKDPESVDARSDIYAVGAVGYFLLTGAPVFDGPSVIAISDKHQSEEPPRVSERAGSPISSELEGIIEKCLKKNPEDRPQSAKDLLTMLGECSLYSAWLEKSAESWWASHSLQSSQAQDVAARSSLDGEAHSTIVMTTMPFE